MLLSFALTPLVKRLAYKIGAVDVPKDKRRMHDHPIPRLGGLSIFVGFVIAVMLFAQPDRQLRGILLGACLIVAVGVVDDSHPLGAHLHIADCGGVDCRLARRGDPDHRQPPALRRGLLGLRHHGGAHHGDLDCGGNQLRQPH